MKVTKHQISKYLNNCDCLALSTSANNKPWVCALLFAHDNDLNLYFVSAKDTRHSKEIEKNPKAACAIWHDTSKKNVEFEGLQMEGEVRICSVFKFSKILPKYLKKFPYMKSFVNKIVKKVSKSRFYVLKPTKIWYLDKGNFEVRRAVSLELWAMG